ncbi:hypothetical protein NDU88_005707 [Pleurodeles waltl]|uniref:Uncharacterized protein n=1 Tax=Pleurodeles waltl TaxID=8319 RepID=A0AAV7LQA5_PLEWA|nr:hypothetical protein NDU88_005707 [Pleurodeles waltl]
MVPRHPKSHACEDLTTGDEVGLPSMVVPPPTTTTTQTAQPGTEEQRCTRTPQRGPTTQPVATVPRPTPPSTSTPRGLQRPLQVLTGSCLDGTRARPATYARCRSLPTHAASAARRAPAPVCLPLPTGGTPCLST